MEYRRQLRKYEGRSWNDVKREHGYLVDEEQMGDEAELSTVSTARGKEEHVTDDAKKLNVSDMEVINL